MDLKLTQNMANMDLNLTKNTAKITKILQSLSKIYPKFFKYGHTKYSKWTMKKWFKYSKIPKITLISYRTVIKPQTTSRRNSSNPRHARPHWASK